jgi:cytochrome c peroxidase
MKIINLIFLTSLLLISEEIFIPIPTKLFTENEEIVQLGKELFFDPILSKNEDVACASCHSNYGSDNRKYSVGSDGLMGTINAPTIFNSKYNISLFWNGRASTFEEQMTDGPLFTKHEMASNKELIESRLKNSRKYIEWFQKAYGKLPTFENVLNSIAKFEETLITPNAKFDKFLRNEMNLTKREMEGYELFLSYGCASCHNGINIGGNSYQEFGAVISFKANTSNWNDRYQVTKEEHDKGVLRVATLRNIGKTAPYFHDASANTLKEAVQIMGYRNIGVLLADDEIEKIVEFLNTLTGELPKTLKR